MAATCPDLSLPRSLTDMRGVHQGETVVVCGCGTSLNSLPDPGRWLTVGVNDVGRLFDPTYLVVLNPRAQFRGDRFRHVEASRAKVVLTQLDLGIDHPCVVRFRLGRRAGTDLGDADTLPYTRNSPYVAVCLAAVMGARRIGLIGVDFTDHHFFGSTGRHPLQRELRQIDHEYGRLARALANRGIELVNLSEESLLTTLEKTNPRTFLGVSDPPAEASQTIRVVEPSESCPRPTTPDSSAERTPRLLLVHYQFLSCGDVITRGIERAAHELGVECRTIGCDDTRLPTVIESFRPDLLFVIHGRRFRERWGARFRSWPSAVWLLDEPYEVDDTERTSRLFDTVFVNDSSTLSRHRNAHYLPTAYDPEVHRDLGENREFGVGFIGGANPTRERLLVGLADAGLLDYLVGGPWRSPLLRRLNRAVNIPPSETAALYRQTRIIVNVFRDRHHFNRRKTTPVSLNPRIYEALACGALVVSEQRPELDRLFPELPTFRSGDELVEVVDSLINDDVRRRHLLERCRRRLGPHSYTERLRTVLAATGLSEGTRITTADTKGARPMGQPRDAAGTEPTVIDGWLDHGQISTTKPDGRVVIEKAHDDTPASELGIASAVNSTDLELGFEVKLDDDTCFIAKLHQQDRFDQSTNSYHLFSHPSQSYLGMHHRVIGHLEIPRGSWQRITMGWRAGSFTVALDGKVIARARNRVLSHGYSFLGVKGGRAELRDIELKDVDARRTTVRPQPDTSGRGTAPAHDVLFDGGRPDTPMVSIVTTVYDRLRCLDECLTSVDALRFRDFEHIVVSDSPRQSVVNSILQLVQRRGCDRTAYANLHHRANNWGIAPAAAGLSLARGRYLCFLSDDNGYTPDHLGPMVAALESDPTLGFVYSSCVYAGRMVLRHPRPLPGGIDLGQPLFRTRLFEAHLGGTLPFDMMAWDWHLIDHLMRQGVAFKHIDRPSFLFRLAQCRRRRRSA